MSAIQIQRSKERFSDPVAAARFEQMLKRADELVLEAAQVRREAWADFRAATGEVKRSEKAGQYA